MTAAGRWFHIGQLVPAPNMTMETGIPAMLRARDAILPGRFTVHSSRMRMKTVVTEGLEAMHCLGLERWVLGAGALLA